MDKEKIMQIVLGLRALADSISAICEDEEQKEQQTAKPEAAAQEPTKAPAKVIALTDVRAVLGSLSHEGYTEQVRSLIRSYGVERLGEIDPADYEELLKRAMEIKYASC